MNKLLYLISLRRLANKTLAISAVPVFSVTKQDDEWITSRTSFNIILIKTRFPKKDYDMIFDTVLLLLKNEHIEKFPHHFPYEQQFLGDSEKDLYQRHIITREGLTALRSNYYTEDWIFNLVVSKLNTIKAFLGFSIIGIIVWILSLVSNTNNKNPKKVVVLIDTMSKLKRYQLLHQLDSSKIDTIIYINGNLK